MSELYHWGIKGQRWGVRRFQNPDGSLTPSGVARYRKNADRAERYRKKAADARLKSSKYLYEKDKVAARRIQTDLSIGKANSLAAKASRANVKAAKYESKAQRLIKANQDLLKPVSEIPKKSNKLVEQAIDDAVEVLSGNMSKEEYNRKYAGTGFKMTGSEKPESGKASYARTEPTKSSGRYQTGFKSRPETASRGTVLDILSSDKKNWKLTESKNGEKEFQYIGPGKGSAAQVKSLRNAGYTYREIEQVLGISSSKIAEILA